MQMDFMEPEITSALAGVSTVRVINVEPETTSAEAGEGVRNQSSWKPEFAVGFPRFDNSDNICG